MSTNSRSPSCDTTKTGRSAYEVGRGKPPQHTRWRKGQSGNPQGRPKGCLNWNTIANELADELAELVSVQGLDGKRKLSKQRAFFKTLINDALKGDARDKRLLLDAMLRLAVGQAAAEDNTADDAVAGGADALERHVQRAIRRRALEDDAPADNEDASPDDDAGEGSP